MLHTVILGRGGEGRGVAQLSLFPQFFFFPRFVENDVFCVTLRHLSDGGREEKNKILLPNLAQPLGARVAAPGRPPIYYCACAVSRVLTEAPAPPRTALLYWGPSRTERPCRRGRGSWTSVALAPTRGSKLGTVCTGGLLAVGSGHGALIGVWFRSLLHVVRFTVRSLIGRVIQEWLYV